MLDFHEKRRLKGILFSKPSIAVVAVLAVLVGISAHERYVAARDTAEKRAERAIELERLKMRAASLEAQVAYLESAEGIEAEIRSQFDVAQPDETVVIIVGDTPAGGPATATHGEAETAVPSREPWWHRLLFWR